MLEVRVDEISLRKWPGCAAQLRILEGTLSTSLVFSLLNRGEKISDAPAAGKQTFLRKRPKNFAAAPDLAVSFRKMPLS